MVIEPRPEMMVRDPVLMDFLPPEGREVAPSGYWTRRLRDGDVVLSTEKKAAVAPAAPPHEEHSQ